MSDVDQFEQAQTRALELRSDQDAPPEQVREALEQLEAAEEPLREQIEVVWQANRQAVQDAKVAYRDQVRLLARVEVTAGEAARRRNPQHPVLNTEEVTRVREAQQQVEQLRQAIADAKTRFKAGVTAQDLRELG